MNITNTSIIHLSDEVGLNSAFNKWVIMVEDYLENGPPDLLAWAPTRKTAVNGIERIATSLDGDIKKQHEGSIVMWEKCIENNNPTITLYFEESGHFFGHYSKRMAYKITGFCLPKIEL